MIKTKTIFPRLMNNQVVEVSGERYRAELWQTPLGNVYEFISVGEVHKPTFTRGEKQVSDAIKKGLIKTDLN